MNESTLVTDAEVAAWAPALGTQAGHVDGHWHTGSVTVIVSSSDGVPAGAVPLVVFDHSDQAGALGYHDVDPQGRPTEDLTKRLLGGQPKSKKSAPPQLAPAGALSALDFDSQ